MELQEQLQRALGSAYRIERELGVGGMATVFAGVETSLGRRVAIKVLQPELVAELSIDRFAREVRLAAQLQQANIVPLLSAGEAGGLSYYTMPLVDGSSLRAKLASGVTIPLPEAISILKDVARALAYAHHAGIVHRDIKPDNILISGGTAVVSDFGIAKAMDIARTIHTSSVGTDITTPGSSLGTPGYMAPEQVAGDVIDHRADIYAWGVVAWELLATRHPFSARTTRQAMLAAHLTEQPPAIQEHARSVPPALAALVMSCLNKDPDRRPQSAGEILAVLDGVATPMPGSAPASRPWRPLAVAAGAVISVLALAIWLPPRLGGSNTVATTDTGPSVAVLPFENIGGDTAQEYFTDGITDELATALGRIPGLTVASRSAAYQLKGQRNLDIRKVGADLGVRYLLLGSVRRSGPEIRIFAQLTEASNSQEIWSDRYIHRASDLIVIQDSLTQAITNALAQQLGPAIVRDSPAAPLARGTESNVAYDLYLKGNHSLNRRRPGLEGAVRSFEGAIAEDPGFGRAYAGLANALALLTYFGTTPLDQRRVIDAANRALAIDSTLADAHVALGILHMAVGRYDVAERELTKAIQIDPRNAAAHFQLGRVYTYAGRLAEAVEAYEQAKLLEPFQATTATWLGYTLLHLGDSVRARFEETRAWELDSSSAVVQIFAAMTAHDAGRVNDALRYIRSSPTRSVMNVGSFAYILGRNMHRDSSLAAIAEMEARGASRWNDHMSISFAALGARDTTRAISEMERGFERDEPVLAFWPLWSGMFDDVRTHPRFAELLRRAGIDPAISARR